MSLRSALAAVFLGVGIWYGFQVAGTATFVLVSPEALPSSAWIAITVVAGTSIVCLLVGVLFARGAAPAHDTSPGTAFAPWDLARYGMGLYALYRATLALGTIAGTWLGERPGWSVPDTPALVQLGVGLAFAAALLVAPRVLRGRRRSSGPGHAGGSPA